MTFPFFN